MAGHCVPPGGPSPRCHARCRRRGRPTLAARPPRAGGSPPPRPARMAQPRSCARRAAAPRTFARASASAATRRLVPSKPRRSQNTRLTQHLDDRRRGRGAAAQRFGATTLAGRHREAHQLQVWRRPRRRAHRHRLVPRAHLARHRRIARQVQAFFDREHGRRRHDVDVAPTLHLLLAAHRRAVERHLLEPGDARPPKRLRDADADLEPTRVGRLVAEEDDVERTVRRLIRANRIQQRRSRRFAIPFLAVRLQVDRAVDPKRHRVAQLFDGLGWAQGDHDRVAFVRFDQPHRLLDPALLVRAHRETQVARVDRARVLGEHDAPSGDRHPLDAGEDSQERMRRFSGSNSGVAPDTATVTWYRSPMYSTARPSPTTACSGGRYAIRMCLPKEGPAPALVTYDPRPSRSTIRLASRVRIGSRPSMYRFSPDFERWSSTVSVHMIAAGCSSRWRRCAALPTKSSSLTRGAVMPASTTLYSVSSSLPCARYPFSSRPVVP